MGSFRNAFWPTDQGGIDIPRNDRLGGVYRSYIPDPIGERTFSISSPAAADLEEAAAAIALLDNSSAALTDTEGLARLLLRAESVASSFIEGLEVSPGRLLHADLARSSGFVHDDATAKAVLANVDAMSFAIQHAREPLSVALIKAIHRRLLDDTKLASIAGVIRETQNWIGGSDFNPLRASFIPPPPELVDGLLEDLCTFANRDDMPALAQAAIVHAQFETIHPFGDGNGRTGRALIHTILRRRGLTERTIPPISLIIASHPKEYVRHLQSYCVDGSPDSPQALQAADDWLSFFGMCARRAATDARTFEERIASIQDGWREKLASARTHSAARALIEYLPTTPLITIQIGMQLVERSMTSMTEAIQTLVEVGVLHPTGNRKRGQIFEAREIIDAFRHLERQLGTSLGDTQLEKPTRPVPQRVRRRT